MRYGDFENRKFVVEFDIVVNFLRVNLNRQFFRYIAVGVYNFVRADVK